MGRLFPCWLTLLLPLVKETGGKKSGLFIKPHSITVAAQIKVTVAIADGVLP